ncbi:MULTISPECIES: hypothetical protein [unclassified Streptomyces]
MTDPLAAPSRSDDEAADHLVPLGVQIGEPLEHALAVAAPS